MIETTGPIPVSLKKEELPTEELPSPAQITLALALVASTWITVSCLLSFLGLAFLAAQIKERAPTRPCQLSDQEAMVGLHLYVPLFCSQAALTTSAPPVPWRFTPLLASFAIKIILALIASIGVALLVRELGDDSRALRILVDLATRFIRFLASL